MTDPQASQEELERRLAAVERSLAELTAAGVGEAALAALRAQAAEIRQQMGAGGVQVGRDQTVQGDLVFRDKIGRQVNVPGGMYVEGNVFNPETDPPETLLAAYLQQIDREVPQSAVGPDRCPVCRYRRQRAGLADRYLCGSRCAGVGRG